MVNFYWQHSLGNLCNGFIIFPILYLDWVWICFVVSLLKTMSINLCSCFHNTIGSMFWIFFCPMEYYISNLYLEGNQVAQKLANCGVHLFIFLFFFQGLRPTLFFFLFSFFFLITLVNCDTMASCCYCPHWDCVFTSIWNALNCCTSFWNEFKVCISFDCSYLNRLTGWMFYWGTNLVGMSIVTSLLLIYSSVLILFRYLMYCEWKFGSFLSQIQHWYNAFKFFFFLVLKDYKEFFFFF